MKFFLPFLTTFLFTVKLGFSQGDDCSNALALSNVNNFCSAGTIYTNAGSTASGFANATCWTPAGATEDVWFTFTAIGSDVLIVASGNGFGGTMVRPRMALYTGSCLTVINELGCNNGTAGSGQTQLYVGGLILGQTYFIRISTTQAQEGTFQLCVNNYNPPLSASADCGGAGKLCNKNGFSVGTLSGGGTNADEPEAGTCMDIFLTNDETNSVWYTWTCATSGTLLFDLTPVDPTNDLDFILYQLNTTNPCGARTAIRCNASSCLGTNGASGLNATSTATTEAAGCVAGQSSYCQFVNMTAGTSYAILINNANGTSGFNVTWGGTGTFVGPDPNIVATATAICEGSSITFDGSTSTGYNNLNWSFNHTAPSTTLTGTGPHTITFPASGSFLATLTASTATGCTSVETKNIFVSPNPTVTAASSGSICSGSSATLTSTGASTYTWSPVANLSPTTGSLVIANPTTTTTYSVVGTNAGGCTNSNTVSLVVNPAPTTTASTTGTLTCATSTVALNSTLAGVNYTWTAPAGGSVGSANTQSTTASGAAGSYTLKVSTASGCTYSTTTSVTQNTSTPSVTGSATNSLSCTTSTTQVVATTTSSPVSYNWTGPGVIAGATTSSATVNAGGQYTVVVTNTASGCSTTVTVSVTQNTTVPTTTASTTGTLTCSTTTVALNSTLPGMNYTWTAPAGGSVGSANTQSTTASGTAGTYTIKVVNPANGCSFTTTTSVTQNTTVPTVTVSGTQTITCAAPTVTLTGSATPTTSTPVWTGGVSSGVNSYTATASSANIYTLTVTNPANGCVGSATTQVTASAGIPSVTTSVTNSLSCSTLTAQVVATTTSSPVTYNWSGPGIITGATTPTVTVNTGGQYTVVVTNTVSACSTTITTSVIQNTTTPLVTASNTTTLTCTTTTAALSGGPASGVVYQWSGAGFSGSTTNQNAVATAAGTYTLLVTSTTNSCTATATTAVTQNTTTPLVTASNTTTLTCTTTTAALSGGPASGVVYQWSGAGFSGSTTNQNAVATAPGTYTLLVTSTTNSCTATATTAVTQNTTTPLVTASNTTTLTCTTTTAALSGGPASGVVYQWSGAGFSGSTTNQNAVATAPGTYTLLVTSTTNSCTATATTAVTQNTITPTLSAGSNQTLTCSSPSITLTGSVSSPTNALVDWGTGVCGTQTTVVTEACAAGVYTLTATDPSNGCVSTSTVEVFPNAGAPTVTISSAALTIDCNNATQSVTVTSTPSTDVIYNWNNTPASASADSSMATFNNAGTYICTVTNTLSGCSTPVQVVVTTNTTVPVIAISNTQTLTCTTTTVAITLTTTPTTGLTYTWSSASTFAGQGNDTIVVTTPDGYSVTVLNAANGCTNAASTNVLQNTVTPTLSAGSNQTLTCSSPSITLTGSVSSPTNALVDWGTGVCGTQTTVVTQACAAGVYTLTATDPSNGCVSTSTVEVFPNAGAPTVTISSAALTIDCNNSTQSVTVTSTPATDVVYHWNNTPASASADSSMATLSNAGTYICTVTNTLSGCSTPVQVVVTTNTTVPAITITGTKTLTCAVPTVTISVATNPTSGLTYTWTGTLVSGQGTDSVVVNQPGIYSVTITNTTNGCINTATSQVVPGANVPVATITATSSNSVITCQSPSVTLTASVTPAGSYSYTWSPSGGNNTSATVNSPNVYSVVVLNQASGCLTSAQYTVTGNTNVPTATVTDATISCGATATGIGGPAITTATNASYSWSNPGTGTIIGGSTSTPTVNAAGAYVVTITDNDNGCTNTATVNVSQTSVTAAFAANPLSGTAPLDVNFTNQSTGATSYSWNFGDVTSVNNTSGATNPAHTYDNIGTYIVVLTASNGSCTSTATISIEVLENSSVIVPNVFTPNGDHANDLFKIVTVGIKDLSCDIFNRWGTKVHSLNSVTDTWDGGGNSAGTYFYILKCTGFDGKEYAQEGYITLFK